MREELNSILAFIGSESLTDQEFEDLTLSSTEDPLAVYEALLGVLNSRESVSDAKERLKNYFLAQGVSVGDPPSGRSEIFVGAVL